MVSQVYYAELWLYLLRLYFTTGMVSQIYYAEHEKQLVKLIGSECSGWYAYLATLPMCIHYGHSR